MTVPVTTTSSLVTVPTARQLRARLRRNRRSRHTGSLTDALTDVYVIVLFVGAYGWLALDNFRGYLQSPDVQQTNAGERYWIAVAATAALGGLAWQGLRAIGPLLVTPAMQAWAVGSPVDRRSWLLPRFGALVLGAACGVGLLGLAAAATGGTEQGSGLLWFATAGFGSGAAGAALSVVAQGARKEPRWARTIGAVLVTVGAVVAVAVVVGHFTGTSVPRPPGSLIIGVAVVALPVAVLSTAYAGRVLATVERAALTTGAQFANAAATAAILLDTSLFTALLESRRWRSVGRVRSRHFRPAGRFAVLLQAELRRLFRHPTAVLTWAALLLAMYATSVALPSAAAAAHIVLGYLATNRLTGGLRALSRSPGLRRLLGGGDTTGRLAHIVVPAVGALIWYVSTMPVVRPALGWIDGLLLAGVVAAAYRSGSRPPIEFGGVVVDTPFGMLPIDLLRQLLRGPDLVAVLIVVQMFWA
jgi:hypothetical protein